MWQLVPFMMNMCERGNQMELLFRISTYVKPVERFIPARNADTSHKLAINPIRSRREKGHTEDSIKCIVS